MQRPWSGSAKLLIVVTPKTGNFFRPSLGQRPGPLDSAPATWALSGSVPSLKSDGQRHHPVASWALRETYRSNLPRPLIDCSSRVWRRSRRSSSELAPGYCRSHDDRRRNDFRILTDRQDTKPDGADKKRDDRQDAGKESGRLMKKSEKVHNI